MKKIFVALVILFQINQAFAYNEYTLGERIRSLNTTFVLQANNFYSETDKLNELGKDPKADRDHMYMLYATSSQSLCIAALTIGKIKNLIDENPQIIGKVLTQNDINEINSTKNVFEYYSKELNLDDQECSKMMPYTYNSIKNE